MTSTPKGATVVIQRSTDQVLQKRFSNLSIDLWNLSQKYVSMNKEATESLQKFFNARYSSKNYKQNDGHLFAAEDQIRAVTEVNSNLKEFGKIVAKYKVAEKTLPALKKLASDDGVPKHLSVRINELAEMEGMPKVPMLAPELKIPEYPFWNNQSTTIKQYIASHYENSPHNFNKAFTELDQMRMALMHLSESSEHEIILVLRRYFAQLMKMKNRFPMETGGEAAIQFAWVDRSSDNPLPICITDIKFEIYCVMFDIGCLHASIGAAQLRDTEDSRKIACAQFQQAAYPFTYMIDNFGRSIGLVDFEKFSLKFYSKMMLAQAYECIYEKSIEEKRSLPVLAKITYQLHTMYRDCIPLIKDTMWADHMPASRYKGSMRWCSIKSGLYGMICYYARGQIADEDQEFGKGVAFYKAALDLSVQTVADAEKEKHDVLKQSVYHIRDIVIQKERIARKENNMIYNALVPQLDTLGEVEVGDIVAQLVKPIAFDPTDPSVAGEDLFKELLPTNVVKVVSLFESRKDELRRKILKRVEERDAALDKFLIQLQLTNLSLDQPDEITRLPDELMAAFEEFRTRPDPMTVVLEKFQKLSQRSADITRILSDLSNRLNAITDPYLKSKAGYTAFLEEIGKRMANQETARKNNRELQRLFDEQIPQLKHLLKPLPELCNMVGGEYIDPTQMPETAELRRILDKVDEMRKQRIQLVKRFEEAVKASDITAQILTDPYGDPEPAIKQYLKKHDKDIKLIDQNLAAQDNILKALTTANANFADCRKKILESLDRKRTQASTIFSAFQTFKHIRVKCDEALEFYDNLEKKCTRLEGGVKMVESQEQESRKTAAPLTHRPPPPRPIR